jgi:hypothetical protein
MRIRELLEGKNFKDMDFVSQESGKREINYDLAEDLVYFMQNDDEVYRRNVYPVIARCLTQVRSKSPANPNIFKTAVLDSYKKYIKEYPIRELPQDMDSTLCKETCSKMLDEVLKNFKEGKYKD